jgi:SSS family transporter
VVPTLDQIIIGIAISITILLGFAGHRYSKTLHGYIFANRSLGPWLLAFSIMATYYSAASFLGGGGATYLYNLGFGAWLTAWHVIGVSLLWFLIANRLYTCMSLYNVTTIPELIERRYGSKLARYTAVGVILTLFLFYLVSVYKGGAIVLASVFNIDYSLALLTLTLPVVVYIVIGGLRSATINNLYLGIMMLTAATITFSYIMTYIGGPVEGLKQLANITIAGNLQGKLWFRIDGAGPPPVVEKGMLVPLILSITFSIGMAQIALPNILVQFYVARDENAIEKGKLIGPVLVALYAMLMFSLGAFCHLIIDSRVDSGKVLQLLKDTDWVIPTAINIIAPEGVRGLVLAGPVAASMSTIAITVLVMVTTLVRDIIQPLTKLSDEGVLKLSKALAVVVAILPIPFALIQNKLIVDMVGAAFGTIFAAFIGPVTIGLFWRKGSSKGAVASMISGTLTGILWYTLVYKSTWIYPTVPAVAIALASYIIPSMFKKR